MIHSLRHGAEPCSSSVSSPHPCSIGMPPMRTRDDRYLCGENSWPHGNNFMCEIAAAYQVVLETVLAEVASFSLATAKSRK
jgi:hypothetical protein